MANTLNAATRSDFGKGAARRYRRDGQVPAVVYGHGSDPMHITLDTHEITMVLRHKATSLDIKVDGKTYTVAPRDIQIDHARRAIEHLDLIVVTAAEAAAIAREAAEASARAEEAALHAAEAAAEKAAVRAARQESEEVAGEGSAEGASEGSQSASEESAE